MSNKKSRLFLWISLSIFALTVIAVLTSIIVSYCQLITDSPDDTISAYMEGLAVIIYIFIMVPVLAIELSCIRSVYKILKYEPKGIVKICYWISAILSFSAFVFYCLCLVGVIRLQNMENGQDYTADVILFTEWLVFIISFVLGSVHKKQDDRCDTLPIEETKK